jgi:hypothetical protein
MKKIFRFNEYSEKIIKKFNLLVWIIIAIFFSQCTYDSEEELFNVCDLENVSFSVTVKSILQNYCYACHSNATANDFGAGLALEDYSDLEGLYSVVLGAVNHDQGFSPMPKSQPKLDKCDIDKLEKWNEDGKPNN